ncbi:MAG: M10 family metallopeptidase C-terminal domain-containing protein, partial [Pseudomonadota bacterium]
MRSAQADYFGISEPEDPSKALQNGDGPAETSVSPEGQIELVFDAPPEVAVDDSHDPIDVCCCSGCSEVHYPGDGHNHGPNDFTYTDGPGTQTYVEVLESLDPSNEDSGLVGTNDPGNGKPIWSAYQTAQHIARSGLNWTNDGDMVVTYRFADATTAGDPNWVFEQVNQAHTRSILEFFAEVTGVTFVEVTTSTNGVQDDADITFRYRDGSNGGGYWDGSNVVVSRVSWEPEMLPGTYNFRLMVHEIGHAMGLSHPGPYNGSGFNYADHADHWNDSYQYTSLSYFNESNTGGSFGNMATLGLHDILAMQIEYGTDWTTRDTDTVYGYNQTTGLNSYNLTYRNDIAFSIWDGDGTDTLDFSGSSQGTELDLREGSFSSVNGQTYNVSIAYNAVIENGVGSAHDDMITGNGVANTIWGGAGDDVIAGGSADAPSSTPDPRHFTGFELNNDPLERDQYLSIADLYTMPADAITLEMMVDAVRMPSGGLIFASYAVRSNSNEFLIEGRNGGNLRIHIDGTFYDTSISTVSLIDGQPHRLSVSWDSTTGALNIYVDGNLAESATFQQGAQIAPGGTLIFGQEQDVQGGSFSSTQIFSGTVGDIRIFDDVRTAGEVSANA